MDTLDTKKLAKVATNYCCEKCDYTTYRKNDYQKHLDTIKHKWIQMDNIKSQNSQKSQIKNYICNCGKTYRYSQGLSKHKRSCTLVNNLILTHNQSKIVEVEKPHIIHNQINIQNIQQQTNNIQINAFGKEDMQYLIQDPNYMSKILNCIKNQSSGLCDLLTEKYFNVDHPENHTIKKTNKKDKFIDCYDGIKYNPKLPEDVITYIFIKMEADIGNFLENMYDQNKQINLSSWRAFMTKVGIPLNWTLNYGELNLDDNINIDDKVKDAIKKDIYRLAIEYIYRKSKEIEEIDKMQETKDTQEIKLKFQEQNKSKSIL